MGGAEFTVSRDTAVPAPPVAASAWAPAPRLPVGNHDIAACVVGDCMYISGGVRS